jgi:hypothetical protein
VISGRLAVIFGRIAVRLAVPCGQDGEHRWTPVDTGGHQRMPVECDGGRLFILRIIHAAVLTET